MPVRAFLGLLCVVSSSAIHQGTLKIEEDGKTLDLHIVALSEKGTLFNSNERSVTMKWGGELRGFLAETKTDDMPSNNYHNFTLLDKEFSYDIDLSSVGCSCNAALFFVSMPGYNPDGSVAKGEWNPYYCDANDIGGVWCWEHDTIEGNMYAMATTPHTCNANPGQYISDCDKRGCQKISYYADPKGFCPDESCEIDTRFPFRIHQRFEANGAGKLIRIVNRLTQNGKVFTWDSCTDPVYLEQMTAAFAGQMAMVFQVWGNTYEKMEFLDEMTGCTGDCVAEDTTATFSNIVIRTLPRPHDDEELVVV